MRISDWSSDVCSSDLYGARDDLVLCERAGDALQGADVLAVVTEWKAFRSPDFAAIRAALAEPAIFDGRNLYDPAVVEEAGLAYRSEEHTSELQSLMRISYAVFCLKKKKTHKK